MAFDLSWLWDLLNSIVSTIQSWFSSLWTVTQDIVNTGQGVFAGLVAFGSQLWDAILKFAEAFGDWFHKAYLQIRSGIENFADVFGRWVNNAFTFLSQGVTWIGSQFYNIGNWLYNSLLYVENWIVNTIIGLWSGLTTWFSGVASAIGTWWTTLITSVNTWFGNLMIGFRNKIIQTITADLTIAIAWKSAERFMSLQSLRDVGYGLMGIISSPLIGRLVGVIVDAVIPIPSSTTYPLVPSTTYPLVPSTTYPLVPSIPEFSYTPPSLVITTPTEKAPPSPTVAGAPTGAYYPVMDKTVELGATYGTTLMAGKDYTASVNTEYELIPSW